MDNIYYSQINKTNVDLILLFGSSTNDSVGALFGLGAKFWSDIASLRWNEITTIDLSNIVCLPRIVIASDVQNASTSKLLYKKDLI